MADPILGKLEIQTDPGGQTRIVLDPATGDVTAGGNGALGDLVLKNTNGTEVARLGRIQELGGDPSQPSPTVIADYVGLRVRTATGVNLVRIGRISSSSSPVNPADEVEVIVGGTGYSGGLRLVDKDGKTRFTFGQILGTDGCMVISAANGARLLEFDPQHAALYIGAAGNEGDLILKDGQGQETVKLDSAERSLRLGPPKEPRIRLVNGNAFLGGNGNDGDLLLFRAGGNNESTNQATIHLDGQIGRMTSGGAGVDGVLLLEASDNRDRIRLEAAGGNIWLGGNGADGDLVIFRKTGDNRTTDQASIHLDGDAGDITLRNADCAEEFDLASEPVELPEPGTVMVIGNDGRLAESRAPYDKRVAGVVSGAGGFAPAIVLDHQESSTPRVRVALAGKVFCRADAAYGPIEPGDLLTTSETPGHAMRATDPARAFGTVIGKALAPLASGRGLVPALVTLQ